MAGEPNASQGILVEVARGRMASPCGARVGNPCNWRHPALGGAGLDPAPRSPGRSFEGRDEGEASARCAGRHPRHRGLGSADREQPRSRRDASPQDGEVPRLPLRRAGGAAGRAGAEHAALVYALAYTGMRWGEVTGLRVRNVDLQRRRARVEENAVKVSTKIVVGTPKTHETRSVPLPASCCRVWRSRWLARARRRSSSAMA